MPGWKKKLAFVISRILGPLPLLCLLWLAVALKSGIGFWKALWVYPLIFLVGIAMPAAISTWVLIKKRGKINIEWSRLEDRYLLIPIYVPFWIIVLLLVWKLTNPAIIYLSLLMTVGVIAGVISIVVLRYKVSAHMAIASATFWGVNFLTHNKFLWLFFMLIPIYWARRELKQHTWKQLIAGLLLANALTIVFIFLFGWPKVA